MKFKKQVKLSYKHLQATSLFAASMDVRFYLMGVLVKDGMIAATNGHCALICEAPEVKNMEIIIPIATVKAFIRKVGNHPKVKTVTLSQIDKEFWLLDYENGMFEFFRPVEGKFPDISRVDIPKPTEPPKEFVQWNLEYVGQFMKCSKILNCLYPRFYPSGATTSTYVEFVDGVHGLLMPLRV
jgi:DNA polymerase-3 subunit beta